MNKKGTVWIYGTHSVKAALKNKNREILKFILLESNKNFSDEKKYRIKPEIVDRNVFSSIFGKESTHQGCAVLVKMQEELCLEDVIEDESDDRPIVFLDQVMDPQNVGSILRASAVLGARSVVLTEVHSPELTPAMLKAASGGAEIVPLIHVTNLVSSMKMLKKHGFWIVGTAENSEKELCDIDLKGKIVFIIGSEGEGIRKLTRDNCDFLVKLSSVGEFTTLNAAQAATISLYESLRQRRLK